MFPPLFKVVVCEVLYFVVVDLLRSFDTSRIMMVQRRLYFTVSPCLSALLRLAIRTLKCLSTHGLSFVNDVTSVEGKCWFIGSSIIP